MRFVCTFLRTRGVFLAYTHTIVPPYRLCCVDIRRAVSAECIFCFVFGAMFVIARAVKLCTTQRGSRARVLKAKWFGNERHVDGRDACVFQSGGEFFASVSVCARLSEWEWSGVSVCVLAGFRAESRRHVKSIRKLRNLCTRGRSLGEFNVSGHILWSCMCLTNMYIHTKYAPFTVCSIYRCGCLIYSSNVTHTRQSLNGHAYDAPRARFFLRVSYFAQFIRALTDCNGHFLTVTSQLTRAEPHTHKKKPTTLHKSLCAPTSPFRKAFQIVQGYVESNEQAWARYSWDLCANGHSSVLELGMSMEIST